MDKIAWVDREQNELTMDQISDRYLLNILGFLERGGGYTHFLDEDKIRALFSEANKRGLKHNHDLSLAIVEIEEKFVREEEEIGILTSWDIFTS